MRSVLEKVKVQCHSISTTSGSSNNASSSSSYPASMPVRPVLKLGRVVKPVEWEELHLQVEEFHVLNGMSMASNVPFSVEVNSFAEGAFRKAYRFESEAKNFPGV